MQVVFHIGAPCTDGDQLIMSLLKNRLRLAQAGIAVPPPGRYRAVIRDTARALKGNPANEDVQAALLEAILDDGEVDRLVISDPRFVCINRLVVQNAQIWPMLERSTAAIRSLFPYAQAEFFIGMRDPSTLIPALFKASRFTDFREFTENMQPHAVAWSEALRRLQRAHPDARITAWCNEDTPLIWGQIMRAMAGVAPDTQLEGVDDLAASIMEAEGFARMTTWLAQNPPTSEDQRLRVLTAFLQRYAKDDAMEETLNVPGWTEEMMDSMSASYDADMQIVSQIPGVTFLQP